MKWKLILFCSFLGFIYWSCDQSVTSVGLNMLPDKDKASVYTDTIFLEASTVRLDSIYAKSIYGLLGDFYDPTYGSLKAGYICQFYPGTAFKDTAIGGRVDSVKMTIYYQSFIGDSLAPMEVSVYPVVKQLDRNYYTNADPTKYCDLNTIYGKQTYTARNMNVSDSLYSSSGYIKSISIRLPNDLGQKFYNEWLKPAPNAFSSLDAFTSFFPGVYLKTTYGTGNIIKVGSTFSDNTVASTYLDVYYTRNITGTDISGNDSIYIGADMASFNVTKEVVQLNDYKNANDAQLLQPDSEKTYLKTPAGVFTKIVIPIPDILKKMSGKKFTNAQFSLFAYAKDDGAYALPFPGNGGVDAASRQTKLLLINTDSITTFFENQSVADGKTSYTTTFTSSTYAYNFTNIANMIQDAMDRAPDRNMELLVIPVVTSLYQVSSGSYADYLTFHFLEPSAVTLKKGHDYLNLKIVATDMSVDQLNK